MTFRELESIKGYLNETLEEAASAVKYWRGKKEALEASGEEKDKDGYTVDELTEIIGRRSLIESDVKDCIRSIDQIEIAPNAWNGFYRG